MYTIRALRNFYIDFPVPGLAMYFQNRVDRSLTVYGYFWLVRGEGHTIVVDSGIGDAPGPAGPQPQQIGNFTVAPGEDTVSLLAREGVKPEDVDTLILTHLHLDHCRNAPLFPRARIVISAEGWRSVRQPAHPALAPDPLFPKAVYEYLDRQAWPRVELVAREQSILPGIDVIYTGGHTPCSQAVSVRTPAGRAAIAGDVVSMYGNLEDSIPVAYCSNLAECYIAMDRLRQAADIVLPSHDPDVLVRHPGGVIG